MNSIQSSPVVVLMVDDDPGDIRLTREAFKDNKVFLVMYDVGDGREALAFLRREEGYEDMPRPDLVLLDLNMPRMDGRETLCEIKKDPDLSTIPVVILTTSAVEEDIFDAYKLGVNCYLTKPVDWHSFQKLIQQIEGFWLTAVKLPTPRKRK